MAGTDYASLPPLAEGTALPLVLQQVEGQLKGDWKA